MIKIIADNKIPFLKGLFEGKAEIKYLPAKEITNNELKDADALITRTRTRCNESLLKGTNVRFIASATIGFDHIDTHYCEKNNIKWTNSPGCNALSVEQYMYSALLNLAQKRHFDLAGKILGIIGVGNVGKRVKRVGERLGMKVLLNDPPKKRSENSSNFVGIEAIQAEADIITLHTPLNRSGIDKTFHLVDAEFLRKVKNTVFIMNTARGEVIKNNDLKHALREKKIAGAVLDVWENEPNIDKELLNLADFGSAHIAGYSADGKANCTLNCFKAVSRFFNLPFEANFEIRIPKPEKTSFEIDCKGKKVQNVNTEIINLSYNIVTDDRLLRKQTNEFEYLRNNYRLRRKLAVFNYKLINSEHISGESLIL